LCEKSSDASCALPLAEWAQTVYRLSQRRAARLIPVHNGTLRYLATRNRQDAWRQRLRELAAVRVRFGYRRLTVLLKREGWRVNAKRIYRLYDDEGLTVRTKPRKKLASRARVRLPAPTPPNECGSMDFVSTRLADGRWFRTLTVLDIYTRESLALVADRSLTGVKVAAALTPIVNRVISENSAECLNAPRARDQSITLPA
jgi:putative transposase